MKLDDRNLAGGAQRLPSNVIDGMEHLPVAFAPSPAERR